MAQRKKEKELLQGNHGAERMSEEKPVYPELSSTPPAWLNGTAKKIYRELYAAMNHGGSLKVTDKEVFVAFCVQAAMVREAEQELREGLMLKDEKGKLYVNPAANAFRLASKAMLSMAVELGLSPRARQGVSISKDDKIKRSANGSKLQQMIDKKA